MATGKFSKPRNREEDRQIEQAFRQVTGQEAAPQPKPTPAPNPDAEFLDLIPELDDALVGEPVIDRPLFEAEPEVLPEEEPEEESPPDFIDKALDFFNNNRQAVLVGLCAIALVLIVGIIAVFFFGSSSDPYDNKILNNVTIAGVNVGGMTKSEAITAVSRVTDDTYSEEDMVVQLPDTTLRLSPADTGAKLDVKSAVKAAYEYGRTGTKSEREEAYLDSLTGNHTIGLLPYLDLDTDYIQGVLEAYADSIGSTLTQPSYALEGDMPALDAENFDEDAPCQTLVLTMGTPGVDIDIKDVYNDILDAYSLNVFLVEVELENTDPEATPDPIDLEAIYEEICIDPVDASVDMDTYEIIPGTYGYTFDLDEAQKLVDKAEYGEEIRVSMEYVAPEVLEDVFFRDVLGSFKTAYPKNTNRTTNLKVACETLNGLVLNPGETFSFNNTLGQLTSAKGYKSAPDDSSYEPENILGGGICQVASTLYVSVMVSDLEITSRTSHSYPVSYIDYGMDASVSWGGSDLKFRNTTPYPIKIEAEVSSSYVSIQILGTEERDYRVEISYEISNTYQPKTVYKEYDVDNREGYTDGQVLQTGSKGYQVKTYKLKYSLDTGKQTSKDFITTTQYNSVEQIVVKIVGETEPPTEESTLPTETTPTETDPPETTVPETTAPTETAAPTESAEPDPSAVSPDETNP